MRNFIIWSRQFFSAANLHNNHLPLGLGRIFSGGTHCAEHMQASEGSGTGSAQADGVVVNLSYHALEPEEWHEYPYNVRPAAGPETSLRTCSTLHLHFAIAPRPFPASNLLRSWRYPFYELLALLMVHSALRRTLWTPSAAVIYRACGR